MVYLPVEWRDKRAGVRLNRADTSSIEATIEGQNEGGIFISRPEDEQTAFVPWTAISYVQLLEDPGESELMIGRAE